MRDLSFPNRRPASQGANSADVGLFGNVEWGTREYDGQPVLTATVDGVLHYEGAGLCRITKHRNAPAAIAHHVADHQKIKLDVTSATLHIVDSGLNWGNVGPNPYRWFITREGANRLVLDSTVPGAQRLKHWLADEVMPAIEDTGAYVPAQSPGVDLQSIDEMKRMHAAWGAAIAAVEVERSGRLAAEARAKELEPGHAQAEVYAEADGLTLKRAFARDVQQWGVSRGLKILHQQVFDFLGYIGIIIRAETSDHDQATSEAIKLGRARNSTKKVRMPDGTIMKSKYGKLTAKGEQYAWKKIYEAIGEHGTLDLEVIRKAKRPALQ